MTSLVVALWLAVLRYATVCRADPCPVGFIGYMNDPYDCRSFYLCSPGHPAAQSECSPGLFFNTKTNLCDFPNNVIDCRGMYHLCPDGYVGRIRHPTDCQSFFVCAKGQPVSQKTCSDGLYFNPIEELCDSPENVPDCYCNGQTTSVATTEHPTSTMMDLICPPRFYGLMRDPTDCQSFFQCTPAQPMTRMSCPSGEYFNPVLETCDFPENVPSCQGGTAEPLRMQSLSTRNNIFQNIMDL